MSSRVDEIAREMAAPYDTEKGGILLCRDAASIEAFARRCVEAGIREAISEVSARMTDFEASVECVTRSDIEDVFQQLFTAPAGQEADNAKPQ